MPRSDLSVLVASSRRKPKLIFSTLLQLAHTHGADWKSFELAVRERYFEGTTLRINNKSKLASNTKLSLSGIWPDWPVKIQRLPRLA